ncbi:gamma carbonic anhydrase family protein [Mycobacterium sp. 1274756.6]|uniref:gamma carbonic anhydrase family protein n=1 Tax=Mycobacterium sp. 1274756.6 TaxID=1834076 RepID=UPI0007FEED6D|nr:gamma carbonic anhydrase family protein [Mycobacterium sp. 1274756.6]OBJ68753.1 gamma carbonic anhydrase family protein [Mycobacterium sp. 1274756.6]
MPLFSFEGKSPNVAADAFVAPTATLIGDVTIEAGASVWFNAVLRGDDAPIHVRAGANVQDGAVLHGAPGAAVEIGPDATVAHLCLIHGARVGAQALIGNQATVLDGAVIGAGSLVAAGALVLAGTQIPDSVLAVGAPAKVKGPLAGTGAELWVKANPEHYRDLAARYRTELGEG